ncbi:MAG TPA: hypothetical protein VEQ59_12795, partial [Polyangiaceae bacterium]|nr:hypothetical protein [Polyangiaceae bacterium]
MRKELGWMVAALLGALSWCDCRRRVELSADWSDDPAVSATGSSVGPGGAPDFTEESAGAGGATAPTSSGSAPPQPPVVACPARPRAETCRVHGDSARGVRIIGTLLEPRQVRTDGVLALDAAGNIACADCDCGDAGGALVIDCPGVVVSPGFVNLHDHLGYAGTPPLPHEGELYEHRNDWRLGENGHAALPFSGGASAAQVLAHELRMVLSGTTSILG